MTTFAHISNATVYDPQQNDDLTAYILRFSATAIFAWRFHDFIQVPNGTLHGAHDNGDGTYTNPVFPPPPEE